VFHLPTAKNAISEFWFGKKDAFSKYTPTANLPIGVEAVVGGAMLISKEVIEKVGLFDERYFMYFEDLDYCRRARKAGFKVWYLPGVKIIHEHGASGHNLAEEKNQWRRLVPSSKVYHGILKHYMINLILWSGQKVRKILGKI
jgi:GT2 family glycosyltransferase